MTIPKRTNAQLLADIRRRLDQGYTQATAERAKRIAARSSDPDFLRGILDALADALIAPKSKKMGAPRKTALVTSRIVESDNVSVLSAIVDLDAMPPRTSEQTRALMLELSREAATCEKIHEDRTKKGTSIKTLCELHAIGTSTYYKWYPAGS